MNCKLKPFHGNEGIVCLTRRIENMEPVLEISFYLEDCKVKFVACTLENIALSWWTSHTKTMGINVENVMHFSELKKLMIKEYCPHEEIQKLE